MGAVAVTILALGGYWFWQTNPSAIDTRALTNDEQEIAAFDSDIDTAAQDQAIAMELEQTLVDIADSDSASGSSDAFDETSLNREEAEIDSSQELAASTNDATMLQEFDTSIYEISQ